MTHRTGEQRRAAGCGSPAAARGAARTEDGEVQVRYPDHGAEQVPWLTQSTQPHHYAVSGTADEDVETGDNHLRLRSAARHTQEDLFEVGAGGGQLGARRQLGDRTVGYLASVVHDDDPRADFLNHVKKMGRDEDAGAGPAPRDDRFTHTVNADGIEAGERLVEEQRRRIPDETAGDDDLPPHALELAGEDLSCQLRFSIGDRARRSSLDLAQPRHEPKVLRDQRLEEVVVQRMRRRLAAIESATIS